MLQVYYKEEPTNYVKDVNGYFNNNFVNIDRNILETYINSFDNAKLLGDKIESKFGVGNVWDISTGCKLIILVAAFPSIIFNANECGDNALSVIFSFEEGNVYLETIPWCKTCLPFKLNGKQFNSTDSARQFVEACNDL